MNMCFLAEIILPTPSEWFCRKWLTLVNKNRFFVACFVLVALSNWHQEVTLLDTTLTVLERPVLYFAIDNCHKMRYMGLLYLRKWSRQCVTIRILLTLFLLIFFFFVWRCGPARGRTTSCLRFLDHTQWPTKVGRTSLDGWSARRRDLYLTTYTTHNGQKSMPR